MPLVRKKWSKPLIILQKEAVRTCKAGNSEEAKQQGLNV
jgi:hypothetical protein